MGNPEKERKIILKEIKKNAALRMQNVPEHDCSASPEDGCQYCVDYMHQKVCDCGEYKEDSLRPSCHECMVKNRGRKMKDDETDWFPAHSLEDSPYVL